MPTNSLHESGSVLAVGEGEMVTDLWFQPSSTSFKIVDDPHDPGPMSCHPVNKEETDILVRPKDSHWELVIKWHVFGVKRIYWSVSA